MTAETVPPSPPDLPDLDSEYFWDFVTFKVEGRLFRVPKYRFVEDSEHFSSVFGSESGFGQEYDLGDPQFDPVKLEDVTVGEFQNFLKVLYPRDLEVLPDLNQDQWMSILMLSTKWRFGDLRKRAISHIKTFPSLAEKIRLAEGLTVPVWLTGAYMDLVTREAPLTLVEAEQFGMAKTLLLYEMREKRFYSQRDYRPVGPNETVKEIERVFAVDLDAMRKKEVEVYPTKEQKRAMLEAEAKEAEARRAEAEVKETEARQRAETEAVLKGEEEFHRLKEALEAAVEEQRQKLEMLKQGHPLTPGEEAAPSEAPAQVKGKKKKKKKKGCS